MHFVEAAKGAAGDAVEPFKDPEAGAGKDGKDAAPMEPLWYGPKKVGPITIALYGPLQGVFIFFAIVSVFLLVWNMYREEPHAAFRISAAVGFFLCSTYLVWIGKAIYILQMFRREIARLAACNEEYEKQNEEHKKLNGELKAEVADLSKVKTQLNVLANECAGSVEQARALLMRLEGSVKLNAVSAVFNFFEKADRDHNGKIDAGEVNIFVENLGFLFNHLPGFNKEEVKETLKEQGGMTLEQVHDLVDALMLEDDKGRKDFSKHFKKKPGAGDAAPAAAPPGDAGG